MRHLRFAYLGALLLLAFSLAGAGNAADEPRAPAASVELEQLWKQLQGFAFEPKQAPELFQRLAVVEQQLPATAGSVDRALVHSLRAELFFLTQRTADSVREALAAATDWRQAGDGPGEAEGLALAGLQEYVRAPEAGRRLIAQAIARVEQDAARPEAAEQALYKTGMISMSRGPLDPTAVDLDNISPDRLQPGLMSPSFTIPAVLLFTAAAEHLERRDRSAYRLADWWESAAMAAYFGGDLASAHQLQERALAVEIRERSPSAVVSRLHLLGNLARAEGDLRASRDYFIRALRLQEEKKLGLLALADTRVQLGMASLLEGDFATANDELQTAWRLRTEAKAEPLVLAESLLNLGLATSLKGDPEGSQVYGRRALELLAGVSVASKDRKREYALSTLRSRVLNNLGLAALTLGRAAEARDWFQQVWDLQKERAPESSDAAVALFNLGTVELQANRLTLAAEYYQRALVIYRRPGGDLGGQAVCLANLGLTALLQKDLAAAANRMQQARDIQEKRAPGSNDLALNLHNLALVRYLQSNYAEAARLETQAWKLAAAQSVAPSEGRGEQPTFSAQSGFANALGLCHYRLGQPRAAFEAVEAGRVRSLQQLVGQRKALLAAATGNTWVQYERVLAQVQLASDRLSRSVNAERVTAENLPPAGGASEQRTAAEALLAVRTQEAHTAREAYLQVLHERDRLTSEVRKQAPRVFLTPLTLPQVQAALPADAVAASFAVGQRDTLLFLLQSAKGSKAGPATGLTVTRIEITPAELKLEVEALRGAVTARGGQLDEATERGRRVFRRLFPGAAGIAVRQARRLLISPDEVLWDVPFAALVTNATGKPAYLGEIPLSYTQSLTLLRELKTAPPAPLRLKPRALIAGNPRFAPPAAGTTVAQDREGEHASLLNGRPPAPLPGTQKEAGAIAELYGSPALTGADATETAVRQRIGQADVVHLATHGFLSAGRAMSSGLLLATPEGAEAETDRDRDGMLQAWEIFGELKLRADLVVLSACETGRGGVSSGDGLVGLTRALQFAGARSVIASQWRVSDASTGALMVELHRKLRSGLPKDQALASAMATLRKSPETAHPYFWAPFVLVGDVENHLSRR